jgi:hypothetical protein
VISDEFVTRSGLSGRNPTVPAIRVNPDHLLGLRWMWFGGERMRPTASEIDVGRSVLRSKRRVCVAVEEAICDGIPLDVDEWERLGEVYGKS